MFQYLAIRPGNYEMLVKFDNGEGNTELFKRTYRLKDSMIVKFDTRSNYGITHLIYSLEIKKRGIKKEWQIKDETFKDAQNRLIREVHDDLHNEFGICKLISLEQNVKLEFPTNEKSSSSLE